MAPSATGSAGLFRTDVPSHRLPAAARALTRQPRSEHWPLWAFSLGCACFAGLFRGDDIEILATWTAFFACCLFRTVCSGPAALQQKLVCRD